MIEVAGSLGINDGNGGDIDLRIRIGEVDNGYGDGMLFCDWDWEDW